MGPRQDFHPPAPAVHSLQRPVEAGALQVARPVAGQQRHDARVAVVIQRILQHPQLQSPVGSFLFAALRAAAVEQMDIYPAIFEAVPQLAQFRRHRTGRQRFLHFPVGVGQPQHIVEVDPHPPTGIRLALALFGQPLRLDEDVGVVPVDENLFHYRLASGQQHSRPAAGPHVGAQLYYTLTQ